MLKITIINTEMRFFFSWALWWRQMPTCKLPVNMKYSNPAYHFFKYLCQTQRAVQVNNTQQVLLLLKDVWVSQKFSSTGVILNCFPPHKTRKTLKKFFAIKWHCTVNVILMEVLREMDALLFYHPGHLKKWVSKYYQHNVKKQKNLPKVIIGRAVLGKTRIKDNALAGKKKESFGPSTFSMKYY